ncbi:hypothetical protein NDU88_000250 [Pleurodeles waltl]|uniref:Uncharacterized protein n=1 Tax=Pleurodeles waltl TaxID=8319 RepID=A0AAV7S7N1_PLEWA|nr:hypothetical protein NDU88_000250 [Pleurodeles waltl]
MSTLHATRSTQHANKQMNQSTAQTSHCEFDKFYKEAAIIEGCHSTGFCMKILKETYMLDKILTIARSEARATLHAIKMENERVCTIKQAHLMTAATTDMTNHCYPRGKSKNGHAFAMARNTRMSVSVQPWDTNDGNATVTTILQASAWVDKSRWRGGDLPGYE